MCQRADCDCAKSKNSDCKLEMLKGAAAGTTIAAAFCAVLDGMGGCGAATALLFLVTGAGAGATVASESGHCQKK